MKQYRCPVITFLQLQMSGIFDVKKLNFYCPVFLVKMEICPEL